MNRASLRNTRATNTQPPRRQGFTIVELLIVIVVIAILAAITIVAYNGIRDRANASSAQSAARQASTKIKAWSVEHAESYPGTLAQAGVSDSDSTTYQYRVDNAANPKFFCVTATTSNRSYYVSSTDNAPKEGGCNGHGVGGVAAVTNMFINPRFDGPAGPHNQYSTTAYAIRTIGGNRMACGTAATTQAAAFRVALNAARVPVTPGQELYVSLDIHNINAGARAFSAEIRFFDTTGTVAGTQIAQQSTGIAQVTGGNVRKFSWSGTAPSGSVSMNISVARNSGTNAAVGDEICADNVFVSSREASFADGSSPGWIWNGEPNNSTSTGPAL